MKGTERSWSGGKAAPSLRVSLLVAVALCSIPCATSAAAVRTANWPGFRGGSARTGISKETGLAAEWKTCAPRLVWESYEIGSGHGSPAIVDGIIYLLGGENLKAIDAATGILLWQADGSGSSTPSIHNGRVFAQASYPKAPGQLICHDAITGRKIWSADILQSVPNIGDWKGGTKYGDWHGSPLIVDDKVVVLAGHRNGLLVAFKTSHGSVAWCSTPAKAAFGRGWSSPMLAQCDNSEE